MRLFRRFSNGLFNPIEVNNYINDKKIFTILFYFLLVILISIPQTIYSLSSPALSYEDKTIIREAFYRDVEGIPFVITSNILFHKEHDTEYVYEKALSSEVLVVIKTNVDNETYLDFPIVIEISRTGVFLHQYSLKRLLFSYNEYEELRNIDLGKAYENDRVFWETVFEIVEKEIDSQKTASQIIDVIAIIISEGLYICILSFVLALFNRRTDRRGMKFSKLWQMVIYLMVPYAFGSILSELFGIGILYYVGLVWSMINVVRFAQTTIIRGESDEL